jgi:hypothetical protein
MKFSKILSIVGAVALAAALSACLNDSGPSSRENSAQLIIKSSVRDVNKAGGLGKASVITLKKLVITLTANDSAHTVRRDTVLAADTGSFSSTSTANQTVNRSYKLPPLRSWSVVVKTLDMNDSVIHRDSLFVANLLAGETRTVPLTLTSRFVMYEAQFTVPDSLHFGVADISQNLAISRVKLFVDGKQVADSARNPRFEPSTTTPSVTVIHTVRFDYVSVLDSHDVKIEFWGRLGSDTTLKKLFEQEFEDVKPTNPNPPAVNPVYVGPSSGEQLGNVGIVINIGKVGTVVFQTNVTGGVPKRGAQ